MFFVSSTETRTKEYVVNSKKNPCKKCANYKNMVLKKYTHTYKLFCFIPIFRLTSYTLQCSACGKTKKIPKDVGDALID